MRNASQENFSVFRETQQWLKENGISHSTFESVTSTNDIAKQESMRTTEHLKVYLADKQTAGRGRGTNSWISPQAGDSLLCSWSFHLPTMPQAIAGPLIGLSLYESLRTIFPTAPLSMKVPNDIYLSDRKLLGLLIETISSGERCRLIIGFGLNVFSHPNEVSIATHLAKKMKVTSQDWALFLKTLWTELNEACRCVQAPHLTETQRTRLLTALNAHPGLLHKYVSVSPFGDVATEHKIISWREL